MHCWRNVDGSIFFFCILFKHNMGEPKKKNRSSYGWQLNQYLFLHHQQKLQIKENKNKNKNKVMKTKTSVDDFNLIYKYYTHFFFFRLLSVCLNMLCSVWSYVMIRKFAIFNIFFVLYSVCIHICFYFFFFSSIASFFIIIITITTLYCPYLA